MPILSLIRSVHREIQGIPIPAVVVQPLYLPLMMLFPMALMSLTFQLVETRLLIPGQVRRNRPFYRHRMQAYL